MLQSVLTKSAHVEAVFRDSHVHTKAHANNSGYFMDRLLGSCLGLISGTSWRDVKSAVEAPFMPHCTGTYVAEVQSFTQSYMQALSAQSEAFRDRGKLHPVRDLKLLPFFFVARIVYGPLDADLERELRELIPVREELFKTVIGGGITRFPIARFLPLVAVRALNDFKRRWALWNDRAHTFALKSAEAAKASPIVGMYASVEEGRATREQLLQTLDEILFANIDVTMGGLSWTLVFLAAHADAQRTLRGEIRAHGAEVQAVRDAYLLSSWTTTPTLLGAGILESARLRPLAAFSIPQSCPTARVLDGFVIPAGTNFIIDSYALNIRDPFWGDDRNKFRPERWLKQQKSGRDLRYRYWRFGFGPRTCLGKYVAELVLRSVVVYLLENWNISLEVTARQRENSMGNKDSDSAENEEENMDWPWDDESWIHNPDLFLKCEPLVAVPTNS
jgi:gliotoxin/aspirochlorine/mycotoxins biosynthesis cytochrome P450 monooxygenase